MLRPNFARGWFDAVHSKIESSVRYHGLSRDTIGIAEKIDI